VVRKFYLIDGDVSLHAQPETQFPELTLQSTPAALTPPALITSSALGPMTSHMPFSSYVKA